jgi:hypothetical protein
MSAMRVARACLLLFPLYSSVALAGDWAHAPKPADYPVHEKFGGKPAAVRLDSSEARRFRTVLRNGSAEGPNFAGHYTAVVWGCGLGAFRLAVVDARNGKVSFPPFPCIQVLDGNRPSPLAPESNPAFWSESRLLVVVGVEDTEHATAAQNAARFYVFEGGTFRLIYSINVPVAASSEAPSR